MHLDSAMTNAAKYLFQTKISQYNANLRYYKEYKILLKAYEGKHP
jgi:hypothetical protein